MAIDNTYMAQPEDFLRLAIMMNDETFFEKALNLLSHSPLAIATKENILNSRDGKGLTAVDYAAYYGRKKMLQSLLNAGAKIGYTCNYDHRLHKKAYDLPTANLAIENDHYETAKLLILEKDCQFGVIIKKNPCMGSYYEEQERGLINKFLSLAIYEQQKQPFWEEIPAHMNPKLVAATGIELKTPLHEQKAIEKAFEKGAEVELDAITTNAEFAQKRAIAMALCQCYKNVRGTEKYFHSRLASLFQWRSQRQKIIACESLHDVLSGKSLPHILRKSLPSLTDGRLASLFKAALPLVRQLHPDFDLSFIPRTLMLIRKKRLPTENQALLVNIDSPQSEENPGPLEGAEASRVSL